MDALLPPEPEPFDPTAISDDEIEAAIGYWGLDGKTLLEALFAEIP